MSVAFIVFLAIVWGMFGLWGFLRGWKAALVMLVLIVGSLVLLSAAPERVAELFDYVNKAAALVTGSTKPLIDTSPSSLVVFMLIGAVILGFLWGCCGSSKPSLPLWASCWASSTATSLPPICWLL